jgi:hypothetical protein
MSLNVGSSPTRGIAKKLSLSVQPVGTAVGLQSRCFRVQFLTRVYFVHPVRDWKNASSAKRMLRVRFSPGCYNLYWYFKKADKK